MLESLCIPMMGHPRPQVNTKATSGPGNKAVKCREFFYDARRGLTLSSYWPASVSIAFRIEEGRSDHAGSRSANEVHEYMHLIRDYIVI